MLEGRTEQHAPVVLKNVLRAIAVVHVKIHDGDALQTVLIQGMRRAHGHIIEYAKARCALALGVMTGWSHIAKSIIHLAGHQQIHRRHHRTGCV